MSKMTQKLIAKAQATIASVTKTAPHVIVEARAGTGKTTTLVCGVKALKGIDPGITPSEQQAAVWDALKQTPASASVGFTAFNKSIATELQTRLPAGCSAMTNHSLGMKAANRQWRLRVNEYRVNDLIGKVLGRDPKDLMRKEPVLVSATKQLVGLCKMNLTEYHDREQLIELAGYYDVELNGSASRVYDLVPQVLDLCKTPDVDGAMDFDDMIWLPVILDLPVQKFDLLLVDECQDLNRCQQALVMKSGSRLVLCGDPKQAIYGFAGADAQSMDRMFATLSDTKAGCVKLPLTVTRRCGRAIVAEANKIVKDFSAHENNPAGEVLTALYESESGSTVKTYHSMVQDGDMVICRVNAPLVSQAFRFIRMGRKANIQGRNIAQGLISTITKAKTDRVQDLIPALSDWLDKEMAKEQAKKFPSEQKIIALQDRYDCIMCFTDGLERVSDVVRKIEELFTDDKNKPGIRLSSVHRAKGLEAHRVFILQPKGAGMPHPMAESDWEREQEYNLKYVAVTRAIDTLVWVS